MYLIPMIVLSPAPLPFIPVSKRWSQVFFEHIFAHQAKKDLALLTSTACHFIFSREGTPRKLVDINIFF
jgi:hypothetical protein